MICPIATYDPAPIRGLTPPPHGDATRIPLAIMRRDGTYNWCAMTFWNIVQLYGLVRKSQLNLFAIMLKNHAQHFVIDLDGDADVWPALLNKDVEIETELRALFVEFFQTQFGVVPDMTGWYADFVPAPESGAREKTSLHINHIGVAFKRQVDLREFVLRLVRWTVKNHPESVLARLGTDAALMKTQDQFKKSTPIDVSVYNADRNMRLSGACKPGKLALVPMNPATTTVEALWASLTCYSMPADPAQWFSYNDGEHYEIAALGSVSKKRSAAAAGVVEPATKVQRTGQTSEIVVMSAETGLDVDYDKGTVCVLPGKTAEAGENKGTICELPQKTDAAGDERSVVTTALAETGGKGITDEVWNQAPFMKHLPAPKAADVKLIVDSLSRDRRLLGVHDDWRNVVWAVKSCCPDDEGYAVVEEWTKGCKKGSKRPGVLQKTWNSGKSDRFNIGSLWRWAKEDNKDTPEVYKALWRKVNPPEVMQAARRAVGEADGGANVGALKAKFRAAFTDAEKRCECDELPVKAVLKWWSDNVELKLDNLSEPEVASVGEGVLEFCNKYWALIKLSDPVVFYKVGNRSAGDDRTYLWQCSKTKAFTGALNSHFVLRGWKRGLATPNVAQHWISWVDRHERSTYGNVPPTARPEVQCIPTCFNTYSGLRVSHHRAMTEAPADWREEWDRFKDYVYNGFLALETSPAVKLYFLKWFASQYVVPGWKRKVAVGLQSTVRQVGKSWLAQFMQQKLLGCSLAVETTPDLALGKFNDAIVGMLFVNIEEFRRCREFNNALKLLITSSTLAAHGKGEKAISVPNCINVWLPTNDEEAIDMQDHDQRVFVVKIGLGVKTPTFEWVRGHQWNEVSIARGLLEWAAEVELDKWVPEDIPETLGAKSQRHAAEEEHSPVVGWVRELVNGAAASDVTWGQWISNEAVHKAFAAHHAGKHTVLAQWGQNKVTSALKEMFPAWARTLKRFGAKAQNAVELPTRAAARTAFYASVHEDEPQARD